MTPSSPLALERRSSAGAVSGRRASRRVVDRSAPLGRNDRGCRVLLLRATPRRRDDAARVAVLAAESAGSGRDERHVATTSCSSDATATIRDGTRRRRARGRRAAIARASAASSSSPLSSADWRQNVSVACVMLAVFLHLLGFTVTGPITPGLVTHFALRASDVGVLTAAYPLGMFGALFAWPRLSDRVGRKPILVLSLLGVGAGLVSQAHCVAAGWSLKTFLALRVASGACAGASPVVKAYLADAASPEDLPQWMAWREASCTLAFIVGPTLGGLLFHGSSLHACIAVTGWASIAAAALVAVVMREAPRSATDDGGGGSSWKRTAADEETETVPVRPLLECDEDRVQCEEVIYTADELNSGGDDIGVYGGRSIRARAAAATQGKREAAAAPLCPLGRGLVAAVSTICLTSFMYNAGQSSFDSFFPVYASGTLGMGPREIGGTLTSLSAVSFGVSAFLFAKITKTIGLTLTTAVGLALVSAGLFALSFAGGAGPVAAVCAATLYVAGIPLFTPAVPILLMQCVPKNKRGAVMGIDSAVNSVARILTPVLLGRYYSGDVGACFFAAGCVVATATVLVIARRVMVMGTGGWFANGSAR